MITIEAPHMGLNDPRAPVRVQMNNTWELTETESRSHIIGWVAEVARSQPTGKLASLVISCHGAPGYLHLGQGFSLSHVDLFRGWSGLIKKIWIRACLVGRIVTPASASEGDGAAFSTLGMTGNGDAFLRRMALNTGAYVVAGTELQVSSVYNRTSPVPRGQLDSFEGLVLSYPPSGHGANWQQRYPSVSNFNPTTLQAVNPNRE